jgi:predicted AlkP superfamily phosphohydrolase/phosphomutase
VIGWGAHDPEFPRSSRPAGLLAALEREHGVHPGLPIEYAGTWHQADFLASYTDALVEGTSRRVGVVRSLLREVPDWDLLVLTLSEAHTAGHYMWHGVDPGSPVHDAPSASVGASCLRAIHQAMDRTIGDVVEEVSRVAPGTVFVVFSIKGMATADADLLSPALVPELFHRLTFGRSALRAPGEGTLPPPIVPTADQQPIAELRRAFADGLRARVVRALRGCVPPVVRRLRALARRRRTPHESAAPTYDHLPIDDLVPHLPGMHWHGATWYARHWPRMPAFVVPSYSDVHVRINLQGRERDGVVPSGEYDDACDRVEAILRACTNPRTGRPIVRHVTRVRASDPCAADGPSADLVVECVEPVDVLVHPEAGTIGPFAYPRTGSHTPNGLAWFAGGDIAAGDLGVRPALDLPPTLLTLLGASTDGCEGEAIWLRTTGRASQLEPSA